MTKRGEGGGSGGGEYSFYKLYKYALPHRMCFFFNLTRSVNCYSSPSSLGIRYVFQSLKPLQLIRVFFFSELDVYDRGGERTKLHHKQIASKTGHIWRSF